MLNALKKLGGIQSQKQLKGETGLGNLPGSFSSMNGKKGGKEIQRND